MKNARLAVARFAVAFAAGSLLAGAAMAAPVAMLQFGSFETRDEAQARLELMKKKHGGVLNALTSSIREIKLPPDDLMVYRTQAGPLPNRAAAQSICAQLASNGDECYVVETAMVAGSAAAPVVPPPAAPVVEKEKPAEKEKAVATATPATMPEPPVQLKPVPMRDPRSVAALAGVSAPASAAATAVVDSTPAKPSTQLQSALDKAVAEQEASDKAPKVEAQEPKPIKDTRSFWSRANPFDDDESAPAPAEAKPALKEVAEDAPVVIKKEAEAAVEAPHVFPPPPVVTQQQLNAAAAAMSAPPTLPVPDPVKAPVASTPVAQAVTLAPPAAAAAPAMDLPPPPAPLMPGGPRPVLAGQPLPPVVAPLPASVMAQKAASKPTDAHSSVNVEEAKRVPLTEVNMVPPPPEVAGVPGPASPSAPLNLLPTTSLGKKTLWAQMGKFEDTQAALAFWDNYRQAHPDFPSVRVRVVSSYQAQQHGDDTKWLRVGPFARGGFISGLCTSLEDSNVDDLQCGQVMDMGVASAPNRVPGFLPPSRYTR